MNIEPLEPLQAVNDALDKVEQVAVAKNRAEGLEKLTAVRSRMNELLLERRSEIDGVLLALLSESTVLLLGPVGTAKTKLVSTACRLMGLRDFEILLSQSTKVDQIFGPVDVPELAKGRQVHKWQDYAPGAEVLFFDEIFKANGTVLNPMLWLINDHRFRNGDEGIIETRGTTTFAASNELPSESVLGAVYDRLMLRYVVEYMEDDNNIKTGIRALLDGRAVLKPIMDSEEVGRLREIVRNVEVPEMVLDAALRTRAQLAQKEIYVSDRRFMNSFKIVRAQAVLNGRLVANLDDLGVLSHLFWDDYDQIETVMEVVARSTGESAEILSSYMEEAQILGSDLLRGDLRAKMAEFKKIKKAIAGHQGLYAAQVKKYVNACGRQLDAAIKSRTTLVIFKTWSAREDSMIFKLSAESAAAWNPGALTGMGFRRRRKPAYFFSLTMSEIRKNAAAQNIRVVVKDGSGVEGDGDD